jgi:hypothetical protein
MLKVPAVTLVIAETRAYELAARAINDLVSRVQFGDILIYSDDCWRIDVPGARYIHVKDWGDKIASGRFYYTEAATKIKTSHALLMEWDAGLNDPSAWDDEFLSYDCVGAPWRGEHPNLTGGRNVGNGGFMLLSKRLIDFLYQKRDKYLIATDVHLCCEHRRQIEAEGAFLWARADVAERFSYEGWHWVENKITLKERPRSFGFHGVFNWPYMLSRAELLTRRDMLVANEFTRRTKLDLLLKYAPELRATLPAMQRPLNPIDKARQARARQRTDAMRVYRGGNRGLKA